MAVTKKTGSKKPSWAMTGNTAKKALAKEDAKVQARDESGRKMQRFWMPPNTENVLTFLDGDLDSEGFLNVMAFYEHQVHMNGSWKNWFVCLNQSEETCPLCESEDKDADLVAVFTVIDHSEWTSKKTGKTYKNLRKLLVAKRNSLNMLQKIATKRGGLKGCTFDVSRTGDKEANIGNIYDFTEKNTIANLKAAYPDVESWAPAEYDKEIVYLSEKELRDMGFGIQHEEPPFDPDVEDAEDDL